MSMENPIVLTLQERVDFVEGVMSGCFVKDEYQPALYDVMFRLFVGKYFSGIGFEKEKQDKWTEIAYQNDMNSYGGVELEQISSLEEACEEKKSSMQSVSGALSSIIKAIVPENFDMSKISSMAETINKMSSNEVGKVVADTLIDKKVKKPSKGGRKISADKIDNAIKLEDAKK